MGLGGGSIEVSTQNEASQSMLWGCFHFNFTFLVLSEDVSSIIDPFGVWADNFYGLGCLVDLVAFWYFPGLLCNGRRSRKKRPELSWLTWNRTFATFRRNLAFGGHAHGYGVRGHVTQGSGLVYSFVFFIFPGTEKTGVPCPFGNGWRCPW